MIEMTKNQQQKDGFYRKMYVKNDVVTLSNDSDYLSSINFIGNVIKQYRDFVLFRDDSGYYTLWNTKTDWICTTEINEDSCDEDELSIAISEKNTIFKKF